MATDKFEMTTGQAHELALAFARNGFTKDLVKELSKGDILSGVREVLEGFAEIKVVKQLFKRDMRKEGWKLVEHKSRRVQSVADLTLANFLEKGEGSILGEKVRERAVKAGNDFGQEDAEYLLEHQNEIPEEWRNYYLVFPGTVWLDGDRGRDVPCLGWSGDQWYLGLGWLGGDGWGDLGRLVSLRK